MRKIKSVETMEGDGAKVKRLFPTRTLPNYDPFVLMDEFFVEEGGFPDHPHRGFEGLTYMMKGSFRHKDNVGNDTTVKEGGAQRFTAGRGIIHSEMPGEDFNHGIQLWVNLPKSLKSAQPGYEQIDSVPQSDGVKSIVGEGGVTLQTKVIYKDVPLSKDQNYKAVMPQDYRGFVYVISGKIKSGKEFAEEGEALFFDETSDFTAESDSRFIYLAGKPHNEPIRQWGPFVD